MTRQEIYSEMESVIGFVPTPFKCMADQFIEQEWNLWKAQEMKEGVIPRKYQQLISLGILAALQDKYGIYYVTEAAKMSGVTDEEIREVANIAKQDVGWGPFFRLNQIDFEQFKDEVHRSLEHMKKRREVEAKASM